jgi:hypothetical protein
MIESGGKYVNEVVVDSFFFFSIYRDVVFSHVNTECAGIEN